MVGSFVVLLTYFWVPLESILSILGSLIPFSSEMSSFSCSGGEVSMFSFITSNI